jgi:DNA-binding NarL/FixJ family response regulator
MPTAVKPLLSPRMIEALRLHGEGLEGPEIAAAMGTSLKSVDGFMSQAIARLHVRKGHERRGMWGIAVKRARELELIP